MSSQERTRFPIQPSDRNRTAKSNRDILSERDEQGIEHSANTSPDKPQVPPHRRHERNEEHTEDDDPS